MEAEPTATSASPTEPTATSASPTATKEYMTVVMRDGNITRLTKITLVQKTLAANTIVQSITENVAVEESDVEPSAVDTSQGTSAEPSQFPEDFVGTTLSLDQLVRDLVPQDNMDEHVIYREKLAELMIQLPPNLQRSRVVMECRYCGTLLANRHDFRKHIIMHPEVDFRPWKCPLCPYRASLRSTIKKHVNIHMEQKPFQCHMCNRGFSFRQKLQQHMKYHEDIRDFYCPDCPLSFHELKTLKNHLQRVHHRDQPTSYLRQHASYRQATPAHLEYKKQITNNRIRITTHVAEPVEESTEEVDLRPEVVEDLALISHEAVVQLPGLNTDDKNPEISWCETEASQDVIIGDISQFDSLQIQEEGAEAVESREQAVENIEHAVESREQAVESREQAEAQSSAQQFKQRINQSKKRTTDLSHPPSASRDEDLSLSKNKQQQDVGSSQANQQATESSQADQHVTRFSQSDQQATGSCQSDQGATQSSQSNKKFKQPIEDDSIPRPVFVWMNVLKQVEVVSSTEMKADHNKYRIGTAAQPDNVRQYRVGTATQPEKMRQYRVGTATQPEKMRRYRIGTAAQPEKMRQNERSNFDKTHSELVHDVDEICDQESDDDDDDVDEFGEGVDSDEGTVQMPCLPSSDVKKEHDVQLDYVGHANHELKNDLEPTQDQTGTNTEANSGHEFEIQESVKDESQVDRDKTVETDRRLCVSDNTRSALKRRVKVDSNDSHKKRIKSHGPSSHVSGHGTTSQVSGHGPTSQVSGHGPTSHVSRHESTSQVSGHGPTSQVSGHGPTSQVSGHGPTSQVSGHGPTSQVSGHEPTSQVSGENKPCTTELQVQTSCMVTFPRIQIPRSNRICDVSQMDEGMADYVHVESSTGYTKFTCVLCEASALKPPIPYIFSLYSHFTEHLLKTHPTVKPYKCIECGFCCRSKSNLISHSKKHQQDRKHACEVCSKTFLFKQKLKVHMRLHINEKMFSCGQCSRRFNEKFELNKHIKKIHLRETSEVCPRCNKKFYGTYELKRHLETHDTSHKFSCEHCDKLYQNKESLQQHLKSHTCVFHCEICVRNFGSYSSFMAHKNMHDESGDGQGYTCKICHKHISTKGSLKRHYKCCHSKKQTYACPTCRSIFKTRQDLKVHQKKLSCTDGVQCLLRSCVAKDMDDHTASSPASGAKLVQLQEMIRCSMCCKEFDSRLLANDHFWSQHLSDVIYVCDFCGSLFISETSLNEHIMVDHQSETVSISGVACPQESEITHEIIQSQTINSDGMYEVVIDTSDVQ